MVGGNESGVALEAANLSLVGRESELVVKAAVGLSSVGRESELVVDGGRLLVVGRRRGWNGIGSNWLVVARQR
jgi:hypothetical protein